MPSTRLRSARLARLLALIPTLLPALVLTACGSNMHAPGTLKSPAETAAEWLTGSFSSADQAKQDPEYMAIDLHMSRIWLGRTDGFWFYVEQAVATTPERPYRQRVYRVFNLDDNQVRSDVFELPGDPLRFTGAWRDETLLANLEPSALIPREGCAITMRRKGDRFEGGTEGTGCESSLRGATFATSQVDLSDGVLKSWDRGWKSDGEQAWGAVKGPYVFVRAAPPR